MAVAILGVHIGKGLFVSNNGYEFGLALRLTPCWVDPLIAQKLR